MGLKDVTTETSEENSVNSVVDFYITKEWIRRGYDLSEN